MANIWLYRILTIVLSPIIDTYLFIRKIKGKEDKERFIERFGYPTIKRPRGKIIWFHAASVGESNAILPVIKEFLRRYKDKKATVLFTSGTTTSAQLIKGKIQGYNVIHQYVPMDKYFVIKRFLKYWKPTVLLMVESEFWPNLVTMTRKNGCKIAVINGKITPKSFNEWSKRPVLKRQVFDCIDFCFPQTKDDEIRFLKLGIQNMEYMGNLKFDVPVLQAAPRDVRDFGNLFKGRKTWLASCTHDAEEEKVAKIHMNLKKKHSNLITIIVLRHPKRSSKVYKMLTNMGLKVSRKSKNDKIEKDTDIYICDLLGGMGVYYKVCDIVLMCGSLIDGIGGHSPVEPAKLGCAIITGPYVHSNTSLFTELKKSDACIISTDKVKDLTKEIDNLLSNESRKNELRQNAYNISMSIKNISKKIVDKIESLGFI